MGILRATALALSVLSAAIWALAGAATWAAVDRGALVLEANAACAATMLAGLWWIAYAVRDRDKEALVEGMAVLTMRRGDAPTRPEYRLERVC